VEVQYVCQWRVTVVLCLKVDSLSTGLTISYNDNTWTLTALASQVALLITGDTNHSQVAPITHR